MILTDRAIADVLAPIVTGELALPYSGTWAATPYGLRGGRPVIAEDPSLSAIVVDRDHGTVMLLDENGECTLNGSLAALVECARHYTAAIRAQDVDDDGWQAVGAALLAQIRVIDPGVADVENTFWAVAAEEVGYGMHAASKSHQTTEYAERTKTQLLLAMADEHRDAAFTREQWRRLTSAADVTVGPPPHRLPYALDAIAQTASRRGRPLPHPQVLVCGCHPDDPRGELSPELLDRLPALRLICQLAAPHMSSQRPNAPRIPTVAIDTSDPTSAIIAAMAAQGL